MKVSDYVVNFIKKQGIHHVFGFIGGAITHLVDSLYKCEDVEFVPVYHEQTAAIAAEGYSRNSDSVGVAMATSGPGATNLLTGIADAFFDSIPAVFITGQVNTYEFKYEKPVRQQGFQETDIISVVRPVTKYSVMVDRPETIKYHLEKAFHTARTGRPGPVLLDIPMDIQRADVDESSLKGYSPAENRQEISNCPVEDIARLMNESRRPLILAGGGVLKAGAEELLTDFARKNNIPVVNSLMGKGAFPEDDSLYVGLIGSYGNRCANMVMANADLLIAAGSRLDTRQTGTAIDSFIREGKIIHIDIDKEEIEHNRLERELGVSCDVKRVLKEMASYPVNIRPERRWIEYVERIKVRFSQEAEVQKNVDNKLPYEMMKILNRYSKDDQVFCVDIGQNQMFSAQMLKIHKGQKFFTSGGLAPMGYAIPVAAGACFAAGGIGNFFAITGDGGFHISTQSLMVLSQYNLPIKVIVLNNRALGMICQFQSLYFNNKMSATTRDSGYYTPDVKSISKAYNLKHHLIDEESIRDDDYLESIFADRGPAVVEVLIEGKTTVVPKLEVNMPVEEIGPRLDPEVLRENMIIDLYRRS